MGERSLFWNSNGADIRTYQAEDLAAVIQQLIGTNTDFTKIGTGVGRYNSAGANGLVVSANSSNMNVSISAGYGFIAGKMYINDSALSKTVGTAHATLPRIDRLVLKYDASTAVRDIKAYVKAGTAASSPQPPALQNDATVKEISLAKIYVVAGRSFITPADITDERADTSVCGYLPLHNLYRGLAMSSEGIVSLPNQSYVESTIIHSSPFLAIPLNPVIGTLPIYTTTSGANRLIDTQGEVTPSHEFRPKVSGVYIITMYIRCQNFSFPAGESIDLQSFIKKNGIDGDESQAIVARRTDISGDNIFQGTAIETLNAGDVISFSLTRFGSPTNPVILNQQVRIHKIS